MSNTGRMLISGTIALVLGGICVWLGNPVRPIQYVLSAVAMVFVILTGIFYYGSVDTKYEKVLIIVLPLISFIVILMRQLAGK